ncbi:hypothetical protein G9G63_09440 [Paenibacillus sp. EKM202P]|uniref:hypothetical protein n=1 Tax=unclassified Paenibacillus TaxID=185978 RepID=UPI0013EAECA1|nr:MULTISPECIES: hypothetical protein [unclassified Paenibacillus]KAF6565372.1 hypothetical protein G9G63_09440 [Paenibacillus sp. EKM202P]KAF6569303.1 hypothetical protein G9G64_12655 [Paenibacillus sp. EKM207P]
MKINYDVFELEYDGEREFIAAQTHQEALEEHFSRGADKYENDEQPTVRVIDMETKGSFEGNETTWREFLSDFEYSKPQLLCWSE